MIELETKSGMGGAEWESLVERCGGHPLHLPEVHAVDQADNERIHVLFRNGSETVGCSLAFQSGGGWFRKKPRSLLFPTPPALRLDAATDRVLVFERILELARNLRCNELVIQPNWGAHLAEIPAFSGHVSRRLIEFVLDLNRDPAAIEAGMHRVHRKNMRRAERDGVTVSRDSTIDGLLTLRSMQQVSSERSAKKGGGFTVRDNSFFERMHQTVYASGRGELLLAYKDGQPIAGLAYLIGARRAITVRSGCTRDGYALNAMYLLQSSVIQRAREKEVIELNLGGVPEEATQPGHPQRGLYEFKRGWGGTEIHSDGIRMAV